MVYLTPENPPRQLLGEIWVLPNPEVSDRIGRMNKLNRDGVTALRFEHVNATESAAVRLVVNKGRRSDSSGIMGMERPGHEFPQRDSITSSRRIAACRRPASPGAWPYIFTTNPQNPRTPFGTFEGTIAESRMASLANVAFNQVLTENAPGRLSSSICFPYGPSRDHVQQGSDAISRRIRQRHTLDLTEFELYRKGNQLYVVRKQASGRF